MSYVIKYTDADGEPHRRQPVGRWNTLADAVRIAQRIADSGCSDVELYEERTVETLVRKFVAKETQRPGPARADVPCG